MPKFAVYEYQDPHASTIGLGWSQKEQCVVPRDTGGRRLRFARVDGARASFNQQRVGEIVAPEGSTVICLAELPALRVPGCPDSRLTAREAVELAKEGRYGLRWEPAAAVRIGGAK